MTMNKDTVSMLNRLHDLGVRPDEALALRRISMTLQRWHELECGDSNDHGSWAIVRGHKPPRVHYRDPETQESKWRDGGEFVHDDDGAPYLEHHHYLHGRGEDYVTYTRIPDREAGAKRRLLKIVNQLLARGVKLGAYIQTDPRGCALYMLPPGANEENYSSRGVAVFK
jgi:hypothetical protein